MKAPDEKTKIATDKKDTTIEQGVIRELGKNSVLIAILALKEQMKEECEAVLNQLKDSDIQTIIITGDSLE